MNEEIAPSTEAASQQPSPRRNFLRTAAIVAAGTVAGAVVTTGVHADGATPDAAATRALTLKDNAELQKIGGWKVVENGDEKLIIARTDENNFVACSAICTHRGCVVQYAHEAKQFVCPCHGARFDLDGNVTKGPAKRPLARHNIESAALLEIAIAPPKA